MRAASTVPVVQGEDGSAELTILVVCTANVCRSPLAAGRIQADLHAAGIEHATVRSAGTDADLGSPMCPQSATRLGQDPHDHAPRELTADLLQHADLVIALDRTHRAAAARLAPACRPRLFTLRQAADLATRIAEQVGQGAAPDGAPALPTGTTPAAQIARLHWMIAEMDAARGLLAGAPDEDADIPDRHGPSEHRAPLADVDGAAARLAAALASVLRSRDRPRLRRWYAAGMPTPGWTVPCRATTLTNAWHGAERPCRAQVKDH